MKRSKSADPAHDVLGYEREELDAIFRPETVAVIGATDRPGSVGRTIMWNLVSSPFGGTVFPVNSRRPSVLGIKAYPSVSEVPARVDLAVIVAPAPAVPDIIGECVEAGGNRLHGEGHTVLNMYADPSGHWGPEGRAWVKRLDAETLRARWLAGVDALDGVTDPADLVGAIVGWPDG